MTTIESVIYRRGKIEGDQLTRALLEVAAEGLRPHCSDAGSWMWLSEDAAARAEAARRCVGCPVYDPCGQAAEARQEKFGTWGGRDRTVVPGGKEAASSGVTLRQ
jgi:hypothetical protein